MKTEPQRQGPGSSAVSTVQRILAILVGMAETRLRLAVVELEQEKNLLIQLLLMVGLTLLFTAFGLMSLIVLIIWSLDPALRLTALCWITATLFGLALFGAIWTLKRLRRSTLLRDTRKELATDRSLLEDESK
ncbi:phage holin family protein [Dickeya solani]|uniref:Phage holin family protein n=1 Tax=Dickeya solani TaxID=1089444 RepID=A0ABU4EH35_9GAMM|nr:phage holin family protein [Dickeya solani]MCA7001348.1 phage holin family protein [Dickeya solani]MCZ0821009.1 phage holin family protein [Dickeya solani]MDV6996723.1 phage holin family protein [Dickeya solani]MDV7002805.1 phage holin family protein [Dickeya solani]MDV7038545.1 phage holin family protein [Dickeya solani]